MSDPIEDKLASGHERQDIGFLVDANEKLRAQLQTVAKERDQLQAKLETLTARSEDFTGAMQELMRERDELRERHARLLSRMRDLRAELSGDVYRMPRMRIYRAIKAEALKQALAKPGQESETEEVSGDE